MKIHGKILQHYLVSSGAPDKEGYLYKKGEVNKSYQKRWFTLKGNLLFYRERRSEREVLGVIVLERCTVQLCDSDEDFAFSISFYSDSEEAADLRTYKFAAEDQASQESWVKALHSAHHGFLALLVQDLHQQYLDAAVRAGVDPVDRLSSTDTVHHVQSAQKCPGTSSVFYTQSDTNRELLASPPVGRQMGRRSPIPRLRRHAHNPTPQPGEWAEPLEDFSQMHEHFGQEVRQMVAEWRRRRAENTPTVEDLIDLG
ncbi:sesquipedalian-1-like [Trichomycterus rosablanca]|uniref:sesquipedalian-1-like n=1 Tax=Trichomycterus rosablanca TaxID=2290929 RepID=UPI002F34F8AD